MSDPEIKNITRVQMLWYAAQIQEDEAESVKYHKHLAEYLATLISAEGGERVKQVIGAESGESKVKQDDSFEDTLNTMFGRAPEFSHTPGAPEKNSNIHLTDEDLDVVRVIRGKPAR